jgi:hypothetical protein
MHPTPKGATFLILYPTSDLNCSYCSLLSYASLSWYCLLLIAFLRRLCSSISTAKISMSRRVCSLVYRLILEYNKSNIIVEYGERPRVRILPAAYQPSGKNRHQISSRLPTQKHSHRQRHSQASPGLSASLGVGSALPLSPLCPGTTLRQQSRTFQTFFDRSGRQLEGKQSVQARGCISLGELFFAIVS